MSKESIASGCRGRRSAVHWLALLALLLACSGCAADIDWSFPRSELLFFLLLLGAGGVAGKLCNMMQIRRLPALLLGLLAGLTLLVIQYDWILLLAPQQFVAYAAWLLLPALSCQALVQALLTRKAVRRHPRRHDAAGRARAASTVRDPAPSPSEQLDDPLGIVETRGDGQAEPATRQPG